MIIGVRGKNIDVKNQNAAGAKSLDCHRLSLAGEEQSGGQQSSTDEVADGDANGGADPALVERIFRERPHAEKQSQAANPGEKFHSEEFLQIQGRAPGAGRGRWGQWGKSRLGSC